MRHDGKATPSVAPVSYTHLIRETRRECLEDQWDIEGVQWLLRQIRAGQIRVREITVDVPSPLSLPLQWRLEAEEMYNYCLLYTSRCV